jgi:uncharacterized protein (DUF111 family)
VLRVWIGEEVGPVTDSLVVLETNIDDMMPEMSAYIVNRCLEAGALDALLIPVIMKKGRPGVKVEVLCRPELREDLQALLLAETTSFGVRWWEVERLAAQREQSSVETPFGSVAVKVRIGPGGRREAFPEYEDCRRAAQRAGVPLAHVYRAAILAAAESGS